IWRPRPTAPSNASTPTTIASALSRWSRPGAGTMAEPERHVTQATLVRQAQPKTAYKPAGSSPQRRVQRRYAVRLWSVRHSRFLEWFYSRFADLFLLLHPVWNGIGYTRVEKPVKFVEKR